MSTDFLDIENVKTCKNNCTFCFISQLPKGMRKSLYLKDEDFRLSFLYGNFTTLSSLTDVERDYIIEYRLTPLYISVHTTDHDLRNRMLRNKKAHNIMKQLRFLSKKRIKFHLQLVLIPGVNDGIKLFKSLLDLLSLKDAVLSIGIVPVGTTRFRKYPHIRMYNRSKALKVISLVNNLKQKFNTKKIYLADEFYLRAHLDIPKSKYYKDFPQIENGIGKTRAFLNSFYKYFKQKKCIYKKIAILCSYSSYKMFKDLSKSLKRYRIFLKPFPVPNIFWGNKVNVCGLLTGSDILELIDENKDTLLTFEKVFISDVILNDDDLTLDNVTSETIKCSLKNLSFCEDSGEGLALRLMGERC